MCQERRAPDLRLDILDLLVVIFNFFQKSCGMSYTVHTKGHSELALLVLLALLALLVVVFYFFHR